MVPRAVLVARAVVERKVLDRTLVEHIVTTQGGAVMAAAEETPPSWRVSSAFIRTGSTTGRSSCWTGRRAFSKAAVARACWERGVSKSVVLLTGDRGFESISLQRRVHCEPHAVHINGAEIRLFAG